MANLPTYFASFVRLSLLFFTERTCVLNNFCVVNIVLEYIPC